MLSCADFGLVGDAGWRDLAYERGAFWPDLLHGTPPDFPGQSWAMFVTYGFLHGGLLHLGVNMLSLISLGRAVIARTGQGGFLAIYAAALLAGGAGYGLLARGAIPMVGASGALFGLAGALIAWGWQDRRRARLGPWPVLRALLWLVAMNVILWEATGGLIAWQTHLGGFLAGAVLAARLGRRRL